MRMAVVGLLFALTGASCAARTSPRTEPEAPATPSTGSFGDAASVGDSNPSRGASIERADLDAFVGEIQAAARARDYEALAARMDDDFYDDQTAPTSRSEILARWQSDPELYLDDLVLLLDGPCAFAGHREAWLCPLEVATLEEYGDAERVHFERRSDGWHWTVFIADDQRRTANAAPAPAGSPSSAPIVDRDGRLLAIAPASVPALPPEPSKAGIRTVVRAHLPELRVCYDQALLRDATSKGRISIDFVIGPEGRVTSATMRSSTILDPKLDECVLKVVRSWTFGKPAGGGEVRVTYPFVFEPS